METHTVTQISRLENSPSGNPRWRVVLADDTTVYTEDDSALGYTIDTDWVGQAMRVAYEQRGAVNVLTAIEEQA